MKIFAIAVLGALLSITMSAVEVSKTGEYSLGDFGDISKESNARKVLKDATQWICNHGGGILIIPPNTSPGLEINGQYQTKLNGPAVTVRDLRKGLEVRHIPSFGQRAQNGWCFGEYKQREINLKGTGLPFQGNFDVGGIRNNVVRGASSYNQSILEAVKKGANRRIYVPTIRGIFVGQNLVLTNGYGYSPPYDRLIVKEIGWDKSKQVNYLVADLAYDHPKKSLLYDKHVTGSLYVEGNSNCDNQTMELQVVRRQYAHGDSFLISGTYVYQGDVISGLGDEQGVVMNAEVCQDVDAFHAIVESMDSKNQLIKIKPGKCNIQKIASSRPIINMNPKKWITRGTVMIVPPDDWFGFIVKDKISPYQYIRDGVNMAKSPSFTTFDGRPVKTLKYTFNGKSYPSIIADYINYTGGCIIGSPDCGWTPEIVGRYFAITEPSECLQPGENTQGKFYQSKLTRKVYRWYLIKQFENNKDGTCRIRIERIRSNAVNAGAPVLYDFENYTWDNHERPLRYTIAPGAYAHDVGNAWKDTNRGTVTEKDSRTIGVVPNGDNGTKYDFAMNDPIEQAIGADPAIPIPIRIRVFNGVPTTYESFGITMYNQGKVAMSSGVNIGGPGHNRNELNKRKDKKPPWEKGITIATVTNQAIEFQADVTDAALYFKQPNGHKQPIKWKHKKGTSALTVDPVTSDMELTGSKLLVSGIKTLKGISGTLTASNNLRGIDIPIPVGQQNFRVVFKSSEIDKKYSINIQPNWDTNDWVTEKRPDGFIVNFSKPAPKNATIDWQLIR